MKQIMVGRALSISSATAWSSEPCCTVVAVDARAGIVSIKGLKVGYKVDLVGGQLGTVAGAAIAGRLRP